MAHDRCLACGTDLNGASRCPNCAPPKPMLLLDLQTTAVTMGLALARSSENGLGRVGLMALVARWYWWR